MTGLETATDERTDHGEGVIWDAAAGLVRWVDMFAGDVLSMPPGSGTATRIHVGTVAAAIRPRSAGGLVIAVERGFALLDAGAAQVRFLGELWADPDVRMNDGACDPQGRFYCGSMAYDESPRRGSLFRLDKDGTTSTVLRGVTISNGLAWKADGSGAYYIDSATRGVDWLDFDPDEGLLLNRRRVVTVAPEWGVPDGMTLDGEGCLWVAMWAGDAVRRFTPEGHLDDEIRVPAHQVTSCAFGGPDLDELYVTTSRVGLGADDDPGAGLLYRCRPGVRGLAPNVFGG